MPTSVEFVDIAGLVKGASKGEGLGNQFLANIRECDAIAQVQVDHKISVQHQQCTLMMDLECRGIRLKRLSVYGLQGKNLCAHASGLRLNASYIPSFCPSLPLRHP